MRRENQTVKRCRRQMKLLGYEEDSPYHKAKKLLKIYRDVAWSLSERSEELWDYAYEMGEHDLGAGLCYLAEFAPDVDIEEFEYRVCCVMESKMLIEVVDRALLRLRNYPNRGELYHEILSKQFINRFKYTETEMLEALNMERSVFYDRKKEAMHLFAVCLFGYTIPELRGVSSQIPA